jgi:hypothetical protein
VSYTDSNGTAYAEKFTITIGLQQWQGSLAATSTPTVQPRGQLVVSGYSSDVTPLQPGSIFNLSISITNLGTLDTRNVTMVLGGGVEASNNADNTDKQNNNQNTVVSGSGSDLSTFAPLGSSNLIYLDTIPTGQTVTTKTQMIVNVSANPGAYPLKLSFTYLNNKGEQVVDEQVITLLVYNLPKAEIGFYKDPGTFTVGQSSSLPLQVTNMGKTSAVLGNMQVAVEGADLTGNVALVGNLEPGGYFSLDVMITPQNAGVLNVIITINYTDDFNQPKVIEKTLTINVNESEVEPSPDNGVTSPNGIPVEQPETIGQKLMRLIKGLLGLGSQKTQPLGESPLDNENTPMLTPGAG